MKIELNDMQKALVKLALYFAVHDRREAAVVFKRFRDHLQQESAQCDADGFAALARVFEDATKVSIEGLTVEHVEDLKKAR